MNANTFTKMISMLVEGKYTTWKQFLVDIYHYNNGGDNYSGFALEIKEEAIKQYAIKNKLSPELMGALQEIGPSGWLSGEYMKDEDIGDIDWGWLVEEAPRSLLDHFGVTTKDIKGDDWHEPLGKILLGKFRKEVWKMPISKKYQKDTVVFFDSEEETWM